ncbi:UTP--glucose-1-phosphate uridylyltransferase [Eumeta japonica]|uniref:UTP--glucose-1-phosphate uridylyltransferase n=1 Tax=Eumeta variegata TaxID=151549 RepID=A0A4C2ADH8_EUMVA|nr:UTP--glucose-1-phosphate uridylyltransferase [Eumeta japonica]
MIWTDYCKQPSQKNVLLYNREMIRFSDLFGRFLQEEAPSIDWNKIQKLPENAVMDYSSLKSPKNEQIRSMLDKLVVIKLNGGLGTSMGCHGPKSVIPVRSDLTFLDLTVQQIEHLNKTYDAHVPLVLMNSFNTDEDTEKIIRKYKGFRVQIYTFNQSCFHASVESFLPIAKDFDVEKDIEAWYPPGHGDFYDTFRSSGLLKQFIAEGHRPDKPAEFVMEVTDKTRADVKGGTLIQFEDKLRLLEIAQVPKEHVDDFKSVKTFKFFNTNNIWAKLSGYCYYIIANHGDRIDIPAGAILENKIVSGNMRILDH